MSEQPDYRKSGEALWIVGYTDRRTGNRKRKTFDTLVDAERRSRELKATAFAEDVRIVRNPDAR